MSRLSMRPTSRNIQTMPINIAGSSSFGRYDKISSESTYNMIISDEWLVPFAGYLTKASLGPITDSIRGAYSYTVTNTAFSPNGWVFIVAGAHAYIVDINNSVIPIGNLTTSTGRVFIDGDGLGNILFVDSLHGTMFAYNLSGAYPFQQVSISFSALSIAYHDSRFIAATGSNWQLSVTDSQPGYPLSWPSTASYIGGFTTKGDTPETVFRFPGRANMVAVMGTNHTEFYYDAGLPNFPYQKNTSQGLDYGCVNPQTIARLENFIVWIGKSEVSGKFIAYSDGGDIQKISSDGIDYVLANMPEGDLFGMIFRQDGHLLYIFTSPTLNSTYCYDFTTKRFFNLTDHLENYFNALTIVYAYNNFYLVTNNGAPLYKQLSTNYTLYDGNIIPRYRITRNIRLPDSSRFVLNSLTFTTESGTNNPPYSITYSLSISKDGGATYGATLSKTYGPNYSRANRINFFNLGSGNDMVIQLQFVSQGRVLASDGVIGVYQ